MACEGWDTCSGGLQMPKDLDATGILDQLTGGDEGAAKRLLTVVYEELHDLADGLMRRERADHTLQPTALVHEAFMKLVDQSRVNWKGKTHFKAVAAQAMRRILIDHARGKNREKRGQGWRRVPMYDAFQLAENRLLDTASLQESLEKMRVLDERQARVVEYRIFGGMTTQETSRMLDVSERSVERDWKMGVAWLRRELSRGAGK